MADSSTRAPSSGEVSSSTSSFAPGAIAQRAISCVTDAPKATKAFAITIVSVYLVTHLVTSSGARPYPLAEILGLVPAYTFSRMYIWNLVTAGFFHAYFIDMVISVITLLLAGKYLEPFWGTREFVKFVFIVNVWSALGCVVFTLLNYATTRHPSADIFPEIPYGGFGGVISGLAVVGKQLIPEYEMPIFGIIPARMRHMPMVLIGSNIAWHLVGLPASSYSFVISGTFTAWIYLRYLQQRPGLLPTNSDGSTATVRGDRSDATSFIGFFPEIIQPTLSKIFCCARASSMPAPPVSRSDFVKTHASAAAAALSNDTGILSSSNAGISSSSRPVDLEAERRRLNALQQVDERIAKMKAKSSASKLSSNV